MSLHPALSIVAVLVFGGCQSATDPGTTTSPAADAPVATPSPSLPGDDAPAVDGDHKDPAPTAQATSQWQCGEVHVAARMGEGSAWLALSGRRLQLPHVASAAGARYADAAGNEFWNKAGTSTFTLAGDERRDCVPSQRSSPWGEAEARGVAFRAVGSEPGWFVEVDNGDMPPLRATLDYGERKVEVASTVSLSSSHGFGGKLADGTDVVLRIKREPCNDGMSGEAFEASAVLTVGDMQYQGCGAYLSD